MKDLEIGKEIVLKTHGPEVLENMQQNQEDMEILSKIGGVFQRVALLHESTVRFRPGSVPTVELAPGLTVRELNGNWNSMNWEGEWGNAGLTREDIIKCFKEAKPVPSTRDERIELYKTE